MAVGAICSDENKNGEEGNLVIVLAPVMCKGSHLHKTRVIPQDGESVRAT